MIARPTSGAGIDRLEAERTQIQLVHEGLDRANRIVFLDEVLKMGRKQPALIARHAFHEPLHRKPPASQRKACTASSFSHSLGPLRTLNGQLQDAPRGT